MIEHRHRPVKEAWRSAKLYTFPSNPAEAAPTPRLFCIVQYDSASGCHESCQGNESIPFHNRETLDMAGQTFILRR